MSQTPPLPSAVYHPQIFEVNSFSQAMTIVVTPEPGTTTEERWAKETRYIVDDIGKCLGLTADSCVLDYGCGPGRVAKGLIEEYGCRVVGVDFSHSMRLLAPEYVLSERFTVWSPQVLEKLTAKGFRATHAICCWVIQHVVQPQLVIQLIANSMQPAATLYLLNQNDRCVPTDKGWVNDGIDIRPALNTHFAEIESHRLPPEVTTQRLSEASMIQVLMKHP